MRRPITACLAGACLVLSAAQPAGAANWLVLTSSEPEKDPPLAKGFGFIQPTYRYIDDSDKIATHGAKPALDGKRPIFNTLSPDRHSNQGFNLFRARLGMRGTLKPVSEDIDYFLLAEFGNNGITRLDDPGTDYASPQLTDASVTLRHLAGGGSDDIWEPGVSLRLGQFQWPVADEGLRGIMAYDYINFSEVARQQVLERFVRANPGTGGDTGFDGPISSYRDIGAMAFDEIRVSEHWEATWAAGVGNGNGINRRDNDGDKDLYLRAQTAYVFDGVGRGGPRREDLKLFAWAQMGERQFDADGTGDSTYERNRYGTGFHFYRQPYRLSGEYMWGNGMVYNGTAPPVSDKGSQWSDIGDVQPQMAPGGGNKFHGGYIDAAYFPLPNRLAVQARYDYLDRLSATSSRYGPADERVFETLTLGLQYWHHPVKSQWQINYRIRSLDAPHNKVADAIGATMGNEIGIQYFHLFGGIIAR